MPTTTVPASAYGPPGKPPKTKVGTGPEDDDPTNREPRCHSCRRRLAEYLTRPFSIRCQRCGQQNTVK